MVSHARIKFGIFDWIDRNRLPIDELYEQRLKLIEAGDQNPRPSDFWEAIRKAAELLWLDHPWATSNTEHVRRTDYLVGLRNRINRANGVDYL